jgi:hypothetical protein
MKTETAESPAPAEVLIPEARRHQRQRYRRGGAFLVILALVVAAIVVSALLLWRGGAAEGGPQSVPKPDAAASRSGVAYFRPMLCFAAPYDAPAGSVPGAVPRGTELIPPCSAGSLLSPANIAVDPGASSPQGYSSRDIAPDPLYATYPSTSVQKSGYSSSTVLLPGLNGACGEVRGWRCVLGPAEMSSRSVEKATVTQTAHGQWVVDYSTTDAGAPLWDRVADENFHQYLGIEVDGVVYTAPLIQPLQSAYSSFDGRGELSGNLNRSDAVHLAQALTSHKG